MPLLQMNLESQYLLYNTTVSIILPDRPRAIDAEDFYANGAKYKVLWLLHGGLGDHSDWLRKSRIELYAQENNLIVVMPGVTNSFYTNWSVMMGVRAYDYILRELMPLVYNWLPASAKKEDNYIAGLSMGAIGAFKYLVNEPQRFAGGAMFSAAPVDLHAEHTARRAKNIADQLTQANGSLQAAIASPDNSWDILARRKAELPPIYCSCGMDDDHYEEVYLPFKKYAQELGANITFAETAGYDHEWRYWDEAVQSALKFFGMQVRK